MKNRLSIRLFFIVSLLFSTVFSQIEITNPKVNDSFEADDLVEVTWTAQNVIGDLKIQYSFDRKNWEKIDNINVDEGSYFWSMPFK